MNLKALNLRLQLVVLFTLLATTVFLWEISAPFTVLAEVGYMVPILYIIWFPLESRNGIILVSITTLLIIAGFALKYQQIDDTILIPVTITHGFSIVVLWLGIYFNLKYGVTLRNELNYKDQLNSIFNYATEGILIVNQLGKIVLANSFAENLFGYDHNELSGLNVALLIPTPMRAAHFQKFMDFMTNPRIAQMGSGLEVTAIRKDGREVNIEMAINYFRNEEGLFVIAFVLDLTDKIKAQEKLKQEQNVAATYFEMAPALFVVLDRKGNVLAINEYGCQLLGYEKSEVINKSWFDEFVPEDVRDEARLKFSKLESDSAELSCEHPILNSKGEEIEMSWKHKVTVENDQPIVLCSGIDISTRKKQERLFLAHHQAIQNLNKELELKVRSRTKILRKAVKKLERTNGKLDRSQKLLTAAIHYFPKGVIGVMNKDMRYIFADGQELNAIGLQDGAENERVFDNMHPILTTASEEKLKWVFTGNHLSYDVELNDKTYTVNAVPIPNHNREINEIMVVITNITESKKLESKLLKSVEKERELALMKSKFVTMASHEFRTPLSTILSSTFLLENYSGQEYEDRKTVHLNRIKQSVNNMTELLNDFILLGKLEEGKIKVTPSDIDLYQFWEELALELEALRKEEQTLQWELNGEYTVVNLDRQLLRSILMNLVSNALKYSPVKSEVRIVVITTFGSIKIQVIDRGMGIPYEDHRHIFKRFFRAQNAINNSDGTGLGLNIVKKHVKLMKGKIEFESKLNEGSTFTVTLPFQMEPS